MSFKRLLLAYTILGFLAGAFAGSLVTTRCLGTFLNDKATGGVAVEAWIDVILLNALREGKPDQVLSSEENLLDGDILTVATLKKYVSGADQKKTRDALVKAALYRSAYPKEEKAAAPAVAKELHEQIDKILADALVKEEPPKSRP